MNKLGSRKLLKSANGRACFPTGVREYMSYKSGKTREGGRACSDVPQETLSGGSGAAVSPCQRSSE
jgi:hypothetical protein